jgi:hypothetical protein
MSPEHVRTESASLRDLGLDERWLQERINEDPSILGLGDLTVIERERPQPSGGRIDFILADPEQGIRFEVEVMLGRVDESHIIRAIEYWDVERTRFPNIEHRAVIVAEEITNRFFNVISILNRAVPIVAIQLNAHRFGEQFFVTFTKVLDLADLFGGEEETAGEKVDRGYWEERSNPASMSVVDALVKMIPGQPRVTYNKTHIALGTSGRNFAWLHARKNASHCHMHLLMNGEERTEWIRKLEEAGISAGTRGNNMKVVLSKEDVTRHNQLVRDLIARIEEFSRT